MSNQDLIDSLQKQRRGVRAQLDAVTDELLEVSGAAKVQKECQRDHLAEQLQAIDSRLETLKQASPATENVIQSLITLLKSVTDTPTQFMPAYHRALTSRTITPALSDVDALIRHLVSDLDEPYPGATLHRFVVYLVMLSDQLKLSPSLVYGLNQWVEENILREKRHEIQEQIKLEEAERAAQTSCLLIKVYASTLTDYHIKAWYITDRATYCENWPQGASPLIVESAAAAEFPSYTESEIKAVIQRVHAQCREDYGMPELVEIFLPVRLMNLDIDGWRLQEKKRRPLFGTCHPVVLRSTDRLTRNYSRKRFHQRKWQEVERLLQKSALPAFCEGDPTKIDGIYADIEKYSDPAHSDGRDIIGLKLIQPSNVAEEELEDLFETALMESALPLMIWARDCQPQSDCQQQLDLILGGLLEQLPQAVKAHRLEAFKQGPDHHIGNHLSLLWDDPHLRPPDSE